MKFKITPAVLFCASFSSAPLMGQNVGGTTSSIQIDWWEMFPFICIPIAFFLFSAVVSADAEREKKRTFILSALMVFVGCALFFVSAISDQKTVSLTAAIMGLIYAGTGLWFLSLKDRYSSKFKALRELPLTAQKYGLTYIESQTFDTPGDMQGMYANYKVEILPDGNSRDGRFIVYLKKNIGKCEISFSKTVYRPAEGLVEFYTGNSLFDSCFKTRYATQNLAEKLRTARDNLAPILNFIKKWQITHWWIFGIWGRSWLTIEGNTIRYSDVPVKGGPYVLSAARVEQVLPDIIALARTLEKIAD